jgi:hypothetical protein
LANIGFTGGMTGRRTPGRVRDGGRPAVVCGDAVDVPGAEVVAGQPLPLPERRSRYRPTFAPPGRDTSREDDGTWSGQLTVAADVDPDLSWFVSALCFAGPEAEEPLAFYEIVEFDVTGPPTPPPTPPTTPTPEASPAVPVEEPEFTG